MVTSGGELDGFSERVVFIMIGELHRLLDSGDYQVVVLQERGGDVMCRSPEMQAHTSNQSCDDLLAALLKRCAPAVVTASELPAGRTSCFPTIHWCCASVG